MHSRDQRINYFKSRVCGKMSWIFNRQL